MNSMYDTYKDIAEFRIIYIREAHAMDSNWPMKLAREKNIKNHVNYEERCTTAEMMMKDKEVKISCIIDNMDNSVNEEYLGHPVKVFLVCKDGKLGVAASRGPWGFKPGLEKTLKWLAHYKKTGEELIIPNEVKK